MIKPPAMRRCTECKEIYQPVRYGLKVLKQCGKQCIAIAANKIRDKEFDKETREMKKKNRLQDTKYQHSRCKLVFNKLRRMQEFKWFSERGLEPACISCGGELGGDEWACGHFKTVGAQSGLRYDPINTYLQHNVRCNKNLSGDINGTATTHGYKQGLVNRFGADKAKEIIDYCDTNTQSVKWDAVELDRMRKEWSKEIREIEKYFSNCW